MTCILPASTPGTTSGTCSKASGARRSNTCGSCESKKLAAIPQDGKQSPTGQGSEAIARNQNHVGAQAVALMEIGEGRLLMPVTLASSTWGSKGLLSPGH